MNAELSARLILDARKIKELLYQFDGDEFTTLCHARTPLESFKSALDCCEKVYTILNHTRSLWQAADYSYKGREICRQGYCLLDQIVHGRNGTFSLRGGSKTHDRYRAVRESLRVLEWQFHQDECERLGLGCNAALTAN